MRRTLAAAVLAASLAAPLPDGPFERLWSFLSAFWDGAPATSEPAPQTKGGCGGDPNGLCNPAPQAQSSAGRCMAQNGLCQPGS